MSQRKKSGLNIRLYCIGEGSTKNEYKELIRCYGVEKDFILLGSTSNPYPFMKQCDIYVQPSRHEGYCITLAEAKCFNKPIVSTNFTGAKEQLFQYESATIIDFNEQQMLSALQKLVNGIDLKKKIHHEIVEV